MTKLLKKIVSFINNNPRVDYLLFFVLGIITLTWFKKDFFISGGCFTWHPDFNEYFSTTASMWERGVSTGYSAVRNPPLFFPYAFYGKIFQLFSSNSLLYEKFLFYISFVFSGASTYFLLNTLKVKRIPRILGGLLYMFNPFASVVVWYLSIGLYFPFYSFLPMVVALSILSIEGKINIVLASLIIFVLPIGATYSSPILFFIYFFIVFIYFIFTFFSTFLIKNYKLMKSYIFRFGTLCLLLFLLYLYWIIPFFSDVQNQYNESSNVPIGLTEDLPTLKLNNIPFSGVFRILGLWSFGVAYKGESYYSWDDLFFTPLFSIITYLIALIVILGFAKILISKNLRSYVWLIFFVLGIFLISGFYLPSFSLLNYLYVKFPYLLRAFRGGFTKFGFIYTISYVVIFSKGVEILQSRLKKFVLFLAIPILMIGLPFFSGEVIFNGGNTLRSYRVKIPEYYNDFKKWDMSNTVTSRYLVLPIFSTDTFPFKWENGYQGADYLRQFSQKSILNSPYTLLTKELAERINRNDYKASDKIISLKNVDKIVFRDDYNWNEPSSLWTKRASVVNYLKNYEKVSTMGMFEIYNISDNDFLPRIYVSKENRCINADISTFVDSLFLNDLNQRTAIFRFEDNLTKFKDYNLQKEVCGNSTILTVDAENAINDEIINNLNFPEYFSFKKEDFRSKPGTFFYSNILKQEEADRLLSQKDPEMFIRKSFYYLSKKNAEVEYFDLKGRQINIVIDNYLEIANDFVKYLKKINDSDIVLRSRIKGIYDNLKSQSFIPNLDSDNFNKVQNFFKNNEVFTNDFFRIDGLKEPVYKIEIIEKGDYEIFIEDSVFKVASDGGRFKFIESRYFDQGLNLYKIPIETNNNDLQVDNFNILEYKPDTFYKISFNYKSTGQGSVSVNEGKKENVISRSLFPTNGKVKYVEFYFKSSENSEKANYFILAEEFSDLKIEKLDRPKIFLKPKIGLKKENLSLPEISFYKMNPTKYKISIKNSTTPYNLVFLDSYHDGWKLYLNKTESNRSRISVFLIKTFNKVVSVFKTDINTSEVKEKYFNGEIKEINFSQTFLSPNIFETWLYKKIPDERHLLVNSYANSWTIRPEDVGGASDYELTLEFYPQKMFYLSLIISFIVFLFLFIIILCNLLIKNKIKLKIFKTYEKKLIQ